MPITHATAQQVIEREGLVGKLTDKVILLTGASSGIGVETARTLYATGAHLFLPVRDQAKGEKVKQDIEANHSPAGAGRSGRITLLSVDLHSLDSVRRCAADFLTRSNAAQCADMQCRRCSASEHRTTQDGLEAAIRSLPRRSLPPLPTAQAPHCSRSATADCHSRVVCVSSRGHWRSSIHCSTTCSLTSDCSRTTCGWRTVRAKTANVYMASEIERTVR